MNTHATGDVITGAKEIVKEAADTFEDAAALFGKQARSVATSSIRYVVNEASALQASKLGLDLLTEIGSLIVCLTVLVVVALRLRT